MRADRRLAGPSGSPSHDQYAPREIVTSFSNPPREEPEPSGDFSLRDYWRIVRARRGSILWTVAAAIVAAVVLNYVQVPTYRAATTVRIDREETSIAEFTDGQPRLPEQSDYIETQYRVLKSRSLARRVIEKLGLAGRVEFGGAALRQGLSSGSSVQAANDASAAVVDAFLERLDVDPGKGTRLVSIHFESVDAALTARVVNMLAQEYIEHNLEAKWQATEKASAWLRQQLASLRTALEQSESALRDYAAEHSILFVEDRKDISTGKLARLEEELTQAEADRIQKASLAALVEDSAGQGDAPPANLDSDTYEALRTELAALAQKQSELLVSFGPQYPKVERIGRQIEEIKSAMAAEQGRILDGVRQARRLAEKREALLRETVGHQRQTVHALGEDFIHYNLLQRETETSRALYEGLLQRLKEAGVSAGLRASNIAVLDPAEVPVETYRPRKLVNMALAAALGLLLGLTLAFVREHFDTGVRTPEEVERLTGLSILALVPWERTERRKRIPGKAASQPPAERRFLPFLDDSRASQVVVRDSFVSAEPPSVLAEAYRTLRSAVLLDCEPSQRRILVTSSQPEEGKTTVSLNLACSLAQLGRRVLLVDADLRRPNCAKQLGIRPRQSLNDYLQGRAEVDDVILETSVPGLSLVAGGCSPHVASDLLSSPRLATLLAQAAERYDHIVIDSPPSLALSDARVVARLVEAVILVVSGATERAALLRTKQAFDQAGARLLGFVMNRVDLSHPHYDYYRAYGYGGDAGEKVA